MRNTVAVIIPIYKEALNNNELTSLNRCLDILSNHPIIFVGPESLNTEVYENLCINKLLFKIISFDNSYFENIDGYNKLMLSKEFYRTFLRYKFVLIYQLDAYVFKDELLYWCKQDYDFIGAPHTVHNNKINEIQFLKGYSIFLALVNNIFKTNHKISNVGNGGFSLRKTRTFYTLLFFLKFRVKHWGTNNEDGFFKYWGNILYPLTKLPSDETALRFSIETNPASSLAKLSNQLPFGCHAFEKYEPLTWQPYLNEKISD